MSDAAERRAVVLDAGGALAGAWAPALPETAEPLPDAAAEPPPPVMRNGGDAPPPPAPAPPPMAPPSFSPPPSVAPPNGDGEDRRGDEEPAVDAFFRRTPHLDLSEEEPLPVGQALTAAVFLDTARRAPGRDGAGGRDRPARRPRDRSRSTSSSPRTDHFADQGRVHEDALDAPGRRALAGRHLRPRGRGHRTGGRRAGADSVPDLPAPSLRPRAPHRRAAGCASPAPAPPREAPSRSGRPSSRSTPTRRPADLTVDIVRHAGQRRAQLPRHGANDAHRRLRDDRARAVELPPGNRRARRRADGPVHAQGRDAPSRARRR